MRLLNVLDRFYRSIDRLSYLCGIVAAILLFLLGPLAFYEVVVRKMGSPTTWIFHILCYIQIFLIWFGLAYGQKVRGHVSVDLVTRLLPLKTQVITRIVSTFLCLVISTILCWQGWRLVHRSYTIKLMTVEEIHHPVYWIQIRVVIGAVFLFLVFLRQLISDIQWLITREGEPEDIQPKE
ncbi:MAG: TRAP transporter small permease [Deltaproteobacteria bacterium]|nr:TRAP transporter small permease [Deltaproteobacteria bacterium]